MKSVSKKEANEQGLKFFFTGIPCKNGHVAERRVDNGDCVDCARDRAARRLADKKDECLARAAEYRKNNREMLRVKASEYYKNNTEKAAQSRRAYVEKNAEKIKVQQAAYRSKNKGKAKEYKAAYYLKNKAKIIADSVQRKRDNPQSARDSSKRYRKNHPKKVYALTRLKQAEKAQRVPSWLTPDDLWLMREIYDLAALRTELTQVKWEVDHIVPLRGRLVSGLHVPTNLRVVTQKENRYKSDQWNPDNGN